MLRVSGRTETVGQLMLNPTIPTIIMSLYIALQGYCLNVVAVLRDQKLAQQAAREEHVSGSTPRSPLLSVDYVHILALNCSRLIYKFSLTLLLE